MKKQLFAILSVFFVLMAGLGAGIAAAEDSTNDSSAGDTGSDTSVSDSGSDTSSDSTSDTDDGSSATDDSPSTDDSTSESDDSVDEEPTAESGAYEFDNVDDTTDEESTNESYTEFPVDDRSDYLVNESDIMIVGEDNPEALGPNDPIPHDGPIVVNNTGILSDDEYNYVSDDDTNITQTTNIENSTIDNSYKSWSNYTETQNVTIDNRQYTNISFTDNSVVNNINFVSKESGKTKVIVKEVHDKPPVKNVYKSFNIQIDNKDVANNVKNAVVDFKVEKSWLKANGLDKSSIVLNMYDNGKWIEVPITITCEDSKYIYFKAEVSRYSTFAITGKTVVVDKVTKQSDSQKNGSSDEEIDAPTKNVVIKLLELIIDLLKE